MIKSDLYQFLWNMYIEKIDAISVLPDKVASYRAILKLRQSHMIDIRFLYNYVKFTYVEHNKYYSLSSQITTKKKGVSFENLEIKLPFFGLVFENSSQLPVLRIMAKTPRHNGDAVEQLNVKMIRHLIGAYSVLKNEATLITEQIKKKEILKLGQIERNEAPQTPKFLRSLAGEEEKLEEEPVQIEMKSDFQRVKIMNPTEQKVKR